MESLEKTVLAKFPQFLIESEIPRKNKKKIRGSN